MGIQSPEFVDESSFQLSEILANEVELDDTDESYSEEASLSFEQDSPILLSEYLSLSIEVDRIDDDTDITDEEYELS